MKFFNKFCSYIIVAFAASSMAAAQLPNGLQLSFLSNKHCIVKVTDAKRYVLLPIEESAPECRIDVISNCQRVDYINARLAIHHIDYYMPLDITRYGNDPVTIDVFADIQDPRIRALNEQVCWSEIKVSDSFDSSNREKFRPEYHHTPLYGWMNDPNGMFYKDGEYHLYYQYNPYGSMWGNMHWGHAVSKDLTHWQEKGIAIAPNAFGTIFSGSCVVDKNNTAGFGKDAIIAIYTAAGANQTQCLAYSTDNGTTFTNYKGNPIITSDIVDFRDPNMFWNEEIGKWNMLLACGQSMRIYSSPDLIDWTLESSFGEGYGAHGGVWECPDLMKLPVIGSKEEKWVLICNLNPGGPFGGSATQYFVGDFDGKTFKCLSKPEVTKWMDYGKDHYATVSWSNAPEKRNTVIAWMSNWQYANDAPTKQYRSANSIARDLALMKDEKGEYILSVTPAKEIYNCRSNDTQKESFTVSNTKVSRKLDNPICEIEIDFNAAGATELFVELSNSNGEKVLMTFNIAKKTFEMDRNKSGITNFSKDFPAVTVAPSAPGKKHTLSLFIDKCSVEAFGDNGRFAMTNLVFPDVPYDTISFFTKDGKVKVNSFADYAIK